MIGILLKSIVYVVALAMVGYTIFFLSLNARARRELGFLVPAIFVVLTIVAFLSPSQWVLHAAALTIIPAFARTRRDAAMLLIIASMATPPFYTVLVFEGLKLVRWSVQNSLALGALFAFAIARGPIIARKPRADVPMLLLLALFVVVAARESSFTNFLREICTALFTFGVPYWVVTRSIDPMTDSRRLLLWISAAATMIGVISIYESMTAWPLYRAAGSLFDLHGAGMFVTRMGFMRAAGPLTNSTVLGYVLAFAFIAAILSRRCFRSGGAQARVVTIISAGLLASQSRGAMLGAAVAVLMLLLFNPRGRTGAIAVLGVVVASLFSLIMLGMTYFEASAADTLDYRKQLMARGIEEFREHPLLGDTLDAVSARLSDLTTGEHIVDFVNTYLYFALLAGVFGALLFLAVILIPPITLWRARRRLPAEPEYLALARFCFAFLIASAMMLGFTSLSDRMTVLLMSAVGLAGTITAPRRRPAAPALTSLPASGRIGALEDDEIVLPAIREERLPSG